MTEETKEVWPRDYNMDFDDPIGDVVEHKPETESKNK